MIESTQAYQDAVIADARRVHVKAVVDIIDPDMRRGAINGVWQDEDVSRIDQLWDHEFENTANYASCELGRWLLDGETPFLPDDWDVQTAVRAALSGDLTYAVGNEADPSIWEIGMVCGELSGPDGTFINGQWAELNFSNVSILQACAVAFSDDPIDGVAEEFTVEVFSEGVAYYTEHVKGNRDTLVSLYGFRVNNPDKLKVTVTKWSLPERRARILELVPGVYEVWTGDQMSEFRVKHQGDVSCLTLPYGTAAIRMDNQDRRFDPRNPQGVFLSIQERQGVELYMGVELSARRVEYKGLGIFYQTGDGWKNSDGELTMQWDMVDIIGMIAKRVFVAPSGRLPTTLGGWLSALVGQLGENFKDRWYAAPELAALEVGVPMKTDPETGAQYQDKAAIRGMLCGDILRYVCMATGTWPRADASTGRLLAESVRDDGNTVTIDNLNKYPTMSAHADVAYVTVGDYSHYGNNTAASETINVTNPFKGPKSNMDMTLNILRVSCGGDQYDLLGRGDPASEVGDVDVIQLSKGVANTARRIRQELNIQNGVLKNCRSTLIRPDGMFAYTNRVQMLESGTFVVPAGVYQLRIILIGAGGDGRDGTSGDWSGMSGSKPQGMEGTDGGYAPWSGKTPMHGLEGELIKEDRNIVSGSGKDGSNGSGGRIWEGVISVNAGQVFQVSVAQKAPQETTFGNYTSRNGERNGFRDIATGESYGGISYPPKPGSGCGGYGGSGGKAGTWGEYMLYDWESHPEWDWPFTIIASSYPTEGTKGTPGSSGSAIIYWENPDGIEVGEGV